MGKAMLQYVVPKYQAPHFIATVHATLRPDVQARTKARVTRFQSLGSYLDLQTKDLRVRITEALRLCLLSDTSL
jgi:hypothetical protein